MKKPTYCLLLTAIASIICPLSVSAASGPLGSTGAPFIPNGRVIVPESSGIGATDKQTLIQHTRMRVLEVPAIASPQIYAQFNTPSTIRSVYGFRCAFSAPPGPP